MAIFCADKLSGLNSAHNDKIGITLFIGLLQMGLFDRIGLKACQFCFIYYLFFFCDMKTTICFLFNSIVASSCGAYICLCVAYKDRKDRLCARGGLFGVGVVKYPACKIGQSIGNAYFLYLLLRGLLARISSSNRKVTL